MTHHKVLLLMTYSFTQTMP